MVERGHLTRPVGTADYPVVSCADKDTETYLSPRTKSCVNRQDTPLTTTTFRSHTRTIISSMNHGTRASSRTTTLPTESKPPVLIPARIRRERKGYKDIPGRTRGEVLWSARCIKRVFPPVSSTFGRGSCSCDVHGGYPSINH